MNATERPTWTKHPFRDTTRVARRRRWRLKGTEYFVVESVPFLTGMRTCFYALHTMARILGRHRTRRAAQRTCERHARREARQLAARRA